LAKGAAVTLPAVLLLLAWWQRGRIGRRDLLRVAPYLLIGLATSVLASLIQRELTAGQTIRTDDWLSRTAVAGCAVWFYLGKLIWPANLLSLLDLHGPMSAATFLDHLGSASNLCLIYPRWPIPLHEPRAFLPGLALLAILIVAWFQRRGWGRPVLMALACYLALLLPALGLANISFMEHSLVADRWQYVAMIAPIALFAAAAAGLVEAAQRVFVRQRLWLRAGAWAGGLVLAAALGLLTFAQAGFYGDDLTLWHAMLEKNPDSWLVRSDLGLTLWKRGTTGQLNQADVDEAIYQYRQAIRLDPDYGLAHVNLGIALAATGRPQEAIEHYEQSLRFEPEYAQARNNLGLVWHQLGRDRQAIVQYRRAIDLAPHLMQAHLNLGDSLLAVGQTQEALAEYQMALKLSPNYPPVYVGLGSACLSLGRGDDAIAHYQQALQLDPNYADALGDMGVALNQAGRSGEALEYLEKALRAQPGRPVFLFNAGLTLANLGRYAEAAQRYEQALQQQPEFTSAWDNLAWLLATHEPGAGGDPARAVLAAERACALTHNRSSHCLAGLAAAQASAGEFPQAVASATAAAALARAAGQTQAERFIQEQIIGYRQQRPCRGPTPDPW
jgi:tetratricopeptide (TPR) repeat protein